MYYELRVTRYAKEHVSEGNISLAISGEIDTAAKILQPLEIEIIQFASLALKTLRGMEYGQD